MTEDEKFLQEMMKAMTTALTEDPEPCCDLWLKALHHHWEILEGK